MRRLVRHELRMRRLVVDSIQQLTPRVLRLTLSGVELAGFVSAAPDDHVKLFVPPAEQEALQLPWIEAGRLRFADGAPRPVARDYTPFRFEPGIANLDIHVVVHPGGHIARWARRARPGSPVGLAGPRGSYVFDEAPQDLLLAGDETALPAMRRWLRELPASARVLVLSEIQDRHERWEPETRASVHLRFVERGPLAPGQSWGLLQELRATPLSTSLQYAFVAGEAAAVGRMRQYLTESGALSVDRIGARGYWKLGAENHQEPHAD